MEQKSKVIQLLLTDEEEYHKKKEEEKPREIDRQQIIEMQREKARKNETNTISYEHLDLLRTALRTHSVV